MIGGTLFAEKGTLGLRGEACPSSAFPYPTGFTPVSDLHITLLDISDGKMLREHMKISTRQYENWLTTFVEHDDRPEEAPAYIGVGYVEQGDRAAYFAIFEWPAAQDWRALLGLPPKDLHVTLCTRGGDVHGVRKDRSTLVIP